MSLAYGLKLACDCYYYLMIAGMLGALYGFPLGLLMMPLALGVGAAIGFANAKRGAAMRYLPLLLALPLLYFRRGWGDCVRVAPLLIYALLYVRNNRRPTEYYYAYVRFLQGMIPAALMVLMSLVYIGDTFTQGLPALFLHIALSVLLLRMLRHEDSALRQKRFQIMNFLSLAGACLAGLALSTDVALRAFRFIADILYRYALLPVLRAALWVAEKALYVVNWVLSIFHWDEGSVNVKDLKMAQIGGGMEEQPLATTAEQLAANPTVKLVLTVIGIAAACVIAFFILRKLSRQNQRAMEIERREHRESLDTQVSSGRGIAGILRRRDDPVEGVRHVSRKFLRAAQKEGVRLNGRQNSLQIRDLAAPMFTQEPLDGLRDVYVQARYAGKASPEDVEKAKQALSQLKSAPAKPPAAGTAR